MTAGTQLFFYSSLFILPNLETTPQMSPEAAFVGDSKSSLVDNED